MRILLREQPVPGRLLLLPIHEEVCVQLVDVLLLPHCFVSAGLSGQQVHLCGLRLLVLRECRGGEAVQLVGLGEPGEF